MEPQEVAGLLSIAVDATTVATLIAVHNRTWENLVWLLASLAASRIIVTLVVHVLRCLWTTPKGHNSFDDNADCRDDGPQHQHHIQIEESCNSDTQGPSDRHSSTSSETRDSSGGFRGEELTYVRLGAGDLDPKEDTLKQAADEAAGCCIYFLLFWLIFNCTTITAIACVALGQLMVYRSTHGPGALLGTLIFSGLIATCLQYLNLARCHDYYSGRRQGMTIHDGSALRGRAAASRGVWAAKLVSLGDKLLGVRVEHTVVDSENVEVSQLATAAARPRLSNKLVTKARFLFRGRGGAKTVISTEDAFVTTLLTLFSADDVEVRKRFWWKFFFFVDRQ